MKKILTILLILVLSVISSEAAAFSKDVKYRATEVRITSDKPLSTGKNIFILDISKKGKKPLGAKVVVKAFMPAMPGMPAMESNATAKDLGYGKYEVILNIVMNGTWQIHIFIKPKFGKKSRVKTSINF